MLKNHTKPRERFVKFIEPSNLHKKLKIEIRIYDEAAITTDKHHIHSIVTITEDDREFGILMYEAILNEREVEEQFSSIIADPMKFKNR